MFHLRWFTKPAPAKPPYYNYMNPHEQILWALIVSPFFPAHLGHAFTNVSQGEEREISYIDRKGRIRKRRLSKTERAGQAIVGDEWMRMKL
jgi:hypothetical protein